MRVSRGDFERIRMKSQDRCRASRTLDDPPSLPQNMENLAFLDFVPRDIDGARGFRRRNFEDFRIDVK